MVHLDVNVDVGERYDALGARPAPRAHAGAAVVGARLWIFGGVADAEGKEDGGGAALEDYAFAASGSVQETPRKPGVFGLWRPLSRSDSSRFGSFLDR